MFWRIEYGRVHLNVYRFCLFTNFSRDIAVIVLELKRKTIRFKIHLFSEVNLYWLQYLYCTKSLVAKIGLTIKRAFFAGINIPY